MMAGMIKGANRFLGVGPDYDQGNGLVAASLHVREEITEGYYSATSAWFPSAAELKLFNEGYPVLVMIVGRQPHPAIDVRIGA